MKIEKFNVERSGGRCDLIIKQARITDAGVYACELLGTDRRNITALLTVLGQCYIGLYQYLLIRSTNNIVKKYASGNMNFDW